MSGDEYQILIDSPIIDACVPPAGGTQAHSHSDVDELFMVTEGLVEHYDRWRCSASKGRGDVYLKKACTTCLFQ